MTKKKINLTEISSFKGDYPELEIDQSIMAGIIEDDPDPMFVTVPIGHVGLTSRNGNTYTREAVQAIVNAVNDKKITGEVGHPDPWTAAFSHTIAPIRWLAAKLDEGVAWGKFYVMQSFPQVRESIKLAMRSNARIGTSIYGWAEPDENNMIWGDLTLEQIDLVHPDRVGNPLAAATPVVTKEEASPHGIEDADPTNTETAEGDSEEKEDTAMLPKVKKEEEAGVDESREKIRELTLQITELERKLGDYEKMVSLIQDGEDGDPIILLNALLAELEGLREENRDLLQVTIEAAVAEAVAVEHIRPVIVSKLKRESDITRRSHVKPALQRVLRDADVKLLLEHSVKEAMGPDTEAGGVVKNKTEEAVNNRKHRVVIPGGES